MVTYTTRQEACSVLRWLARFLLFPYSVAVGRTVKNVFLGTTDRFEKLAQNPAQHRQSYSLAKTVYRSCTAISGQFIFDLFLFQLLSVLRSACMYYVGWPCVCVCNSAVRRIFFPLLSPYVYICSFGLVMFNSAQAHYFPYISHRRYTVILRMSTVNNCLPM